MQSIFRLPGLAWSQQSTATALDKVVSFVPMSNGAANNKIKRKRAVESPRSSPQPVVKKIKSIQPSQSPLQSVSSQGHVEGGAVKVMIQGGGLPEQIIRSTSVSATSLGSNQHNSSSSVVGSAVEKKPSALPSTGSTGSYTSVLSRSGSVGSVGSPRSPLMSLAPLAPAAKPSVQLIKNSLTKGNLSKPAHVVGASAPYISHVPAVNAVASVSGQVTKVQPALSNSGIAPPTPVTPSSSAEFPIAMNIATQPPSSHPAATISTTTSVTVDAEKNNTTSCTSMPTNIKIDKDMLRGIIEAEICQAILFKHNELRLIDQEIAKCQIALEQIRRCEEIPYPGSRGPSLDVSNHSGPALVTRRGLAPPVSPAPWGVTEGPYTEHYASWLIPSGRFDAAPRHSSGSLVTVGTCAKDSRLTRGLSTAEASPMSISIPPSRASRVASRSKAHLEPGSPLTGRDPLIIKRQKDGAMVKLFCTQCQPERSNFANVQGFLNHCRISHKNDYKSHEQAAIECGRVVDPSDYFGASGSIATPKEPMTKTPTFTPSQSFSLTTTVPMPTVTTFALDKQTIHPLNKPILPTKERHSVSTPILPREYSKHTSVNSTGLLSPVNSPDFSSATETPFLSKLVQKAGTVANFASVVTEVKAKVDLSVYEVESEGEATENQDPKKSKIGKSKSASQHRRQVKPGTAIPKVRSSLVHSNQDESLDSTHGTVASTPDADVMDVDQALSPHTSADSNPGLVSDREDEFADDDDEPEVLRTQSQGEIDMIRIEDSDLERNAEGHINAQPCRNGRVGLSAGGC